MSFYSRACKIKGFSFLELAVVVCIIFILMAVSASRYQLYLKHSQEKVFLYQASAFSRMIENIYALGITQNSHKVDLGEGLIIYTNLKGWPYATNRLGKSLTKISTTQGCESLWLDLFTKIEKEDRSDSQLAKENFLISLINRSTCRYKLLRKQDGSFFFDYDISTGKVAIVTPD